MMNGRPSARAGVLGLLSLTVVVVASSCGRSDTPPKKPESLASAVRDTPRADTTRLTKAPYDSVRDEGESNNPYTYTARLGDLGLLLRASEDPADAEFNFVFMTEEGADLAALGLFPVSALIDSTATVEALGEDQHTIHLVADPGMDSVLRRELVMECPSPIRVKLDLRSTRPSWHIGLRSGVKREAPRASLPSDDDLAKRLAAAVPDSSRPMMDSGPSAEALFAKVPYTVTGAEHFTDGDQDVFVVSTRRLATRALVAGDTSSFAESVFLVAERPAGSSEPFTIGWSVRRAGFASEMAERFLLQAIRSGQASRLTLIVIASGDYVMGGDFLVRAAPGTWKVIAHWDNGCD